MNPLVEATAARWARLGAMLNVPPSSSTPDLERLLLDTARVAPANSRLFILAATWLARYGDYVARHRLARLIAEELEPEHRPTLGLMLDWARARGEANASRFNLAIEACSRGPRGEPRPLFDVERRSPVLARLARHRASPLSRKWRRWTADFEPKDDALRPPGWVASENPSLAERALTGGDLAASILAECEAAGGSVPSELDLARRCGASRPAVRDALRRLVLAGRVTVTAQGKGHPSVVRLRQVA